MRRSLPRGAERDPDRAHRTTRAGRPNGATATGASALQRRARTDAPPLKAGRRGSPLADIQTLNQNDHVEDLQIEEEMKDSYLTYAMSVIVSRALPRFEDGLKPVSYTHLTLPTN